jgi:hypothetical protein
MESKNQVLDDYDSDGDPFNWEMIQTDTFYSGGIFEFVEFSPVMSLKRKYESAKNKIKNDLNKKINEVQSQVLCSWPTLQKIFYTFGVTGLWVISFTMGKAPWLIPHLYSTLAILLITTRYFVYRRKSWHYFCFDLCYTVNISLIVWYYLMPTNQILYTSVFSLSHGPLAWAVLAWRNSMVFHSLDKITV